MLDVALGELIRPARVARAGDGDFPLLSMTMHQGLVNQSGRFKKRIASKDLSEYKVVKRGQLVVGFPIDEGVLDFQELYSAGIVSPAYGIWDVRDETRVDRRFLKLALRSDRSFAYYRSKLRGSTARRRSLPSDVFLALPIALPSIAEQRRFAAILDAADAVRSRRKVILDHLDSLSDALFYQAFGDPLSNSAAEMCRPLGLVAQVMTGNSPSRQDPKNFGDDIEWIKSGNLGGRIATRAEEGLSKVGRQKARIAPRGSVLVTCIAGSPTSIGKASIVDRDVAFNQQINAVLPSAQLRPEFLLVQFRVAPDLVRRKSTGGMKGLVSKSAFETIEVLVPSIDAQEAFVSRTSVVDAQRAAVQRALATDDELFASLQSRAFSGKL